MGRITDAEEIIGNLLILSLICINNTNIGAYHEGP